MLDLCRQRQRNRALSPLEKIGVPTVRNDHIGQEMRRKSNIGHRLLNRDVLQPQLQNTDCFTAAGHGRKQPSTAMLDDHLDGLAGQRPPVRRPNQRYPLRGLPPLQPQHSLPARVAESNQRPPTEVRDQEADLAGTERVRQRRRHHIDRGDRRGRLDRRQQ